MIHYGRDFSANSEDRKYNLRDLLTLTLVEVRIESGTDTFKYDTFKYIWYTTLIPSLA